ncbi:MAG: hypothetical protein IKA57_00755, partial [Clostridia bacterium]|nr:hypothetical protein [Clostridia bacterium]
YAEIRDRIRCSHLQAKILGFLYLLGTLALIVLACFPIVKINGVLLGVMSFWEPFDTVLKAGNPLSALLTNCIDVVVAFLYMCMLLGLLIRVIRSLWQLPWLFKTKASKLYGFNRNMFAMEKLAKIFSGAFSGMICMYMLMILFGGAFQYGWLVYVVLGFGLAWHLLLTPFMGCVSLYTTEDGIIEEKRQVGVFAPILRNVIQLCATGLIVFWAVKHLTEKVLFHELLAYILECIEEKALVGDVTLVIVPILNVLLIGAIFGMVKHALSIREFDSEGTKVRGRRKFLWASLSVFIISVLMYAGGILFAKHQISRDIMFIVLVAFAAFIVEILLRKYPKHPYVDKDEVDAITYIMEDQATYGNVSGAMPYFPYPYMMYPYNPYNTGNTKTKK